MVHLIWGTVYLELTQLDPMQIERLALRVESPELGRHPRPYKHLQSSQPMIYHKMYRILYTGFLSVDIFRSYWKVKKA